MRFIGVTGHGLSVPAMHRAQPRALRVRLRPVPVQLRADAGPALRGDLRGARRRCARSATSRCRRSRASRRGRWDGRERTASTWYEPLREQADIDLAAHWVLGRPGGVPAHHRRRRDPAAAARRGRALRGAPADEQMASSPSGQASRRCSSSASSASRPRPSRLRSSSSRRPRGASRAAARRGRACRRAARRAAGRARPRGRTLRWRRFVTSVARGGLVAGERARLRALAGRGAPARGGRACSCTRLAA